jgi:hypothetical protein
MHLTAWLPMWCVCFSVPCCNNSMACYKLEEYETAQDAFEKGHQLAGEKNPQYSIWAQKCKNAIAGEAVADVSDCHVQAVSAQGLSQCSTPKSGQLSGLWTWSCPMQRCRQAAAALNSSHDRTPNTHYRWRCRRLASSHVV